MTEVGPTLTLRDIADLAAADAWTMPASHSPTSVA
jgi:hypothetical protein